MRALSNLIAVNDPQLVLFVGEALVSQLFAQLSQHLETREITHVLCSPCVVYVIICNSAGLNQPQITPPYTHLPAGRQ